MFSPPAADWRDTPEALVLEIRTPGYRRRDLTLEIDGRSLRVRGERRRGLFRPSYQAFEERFSLPAAVEPEGVRAGFRDGVLWVSVAKRPEARRRVISINVRAGATDRSKAEVSDRAGRPVAWLRRGLDGLSQAFLRLRSELGWRSYRPTSKAALPAASSS